MARSTVSYAQISEDIDNRISKGDYRADEPLPSILALAKEYDVAPMTVRRAITRLCNAGRLRAVSGVGTFPLARCALEGVILVTQLDALESGTPWLGQAHTLRGAKRAAAEAGIPIIIADQNDDPRKFLRARHGYLVHSLEALPEWVRMILNERLPYVSVGYDVGLPNYISRDMEAAVLKGLRHLHKLGHRRVVVLGRSHVSGDSIFPSVRPPTGMEIIELTIQMPGTYEVMGSMSVIKSVLAPLFTKRVEERPTAVITGSGVFVPATMAFMESIGIRVPLDCSVVGFCRDMHAHWQGKQVTRVDNPLEQMAQRAVEELIRMAAGGGYAPGRIMVEPDFVDGETCARPPAQAELQVAADTGVA